MTLRLRTRVFLLFALCAGVTGAFTNEERSKKRAAVYYPPSGDAWQHARPEVVGMNSALLDHSRTLKESPESGVKIVSDDAA